MARARTAPTLTVRLPDELDLWVRQEADRRMVSAAFLVVQALERLRTSIPSTDAAA
jgi:predicted transcriptional regulator